MKILSDNIVYEYKCNNQITNISYPKEENNNLIFYLIKFNNNKRIYNVPLEKREWILQKLIFNGKTFFEETISTLDIPNSYTLNQKNSEVNFFKYQNEIFYIVLSNLEGIASIFKFDINGKLIKKEFDGFIIIPNRFNDENLWYIKCKDVKKFFLMREHQEICEVNNYLTQGYFISDTIIEFIFYDTSDFGTINFRPKYSSLLYNLS